MPRKESSKRRFPIPLLILGAAAGLCFAPDHLTSKIRLALHDALRPGQKLVRAGAAEGLARWNRLRDTTDHSDEVANLRSELEGAQLALRQSQLQAARLQENLQTAERLGPSPYSSSPSENLFVAELLQAHVLGEATRALWRGGAILDKGAPDGVEEMALVLEDPRLMVDQGGTNGVEPEQDVYAGRCVIGRIATVGRWASTVQRVTDKDYRGLARLARQTSRGLILLSEGILQGDGTDTCKFTGIPVTDAVEIGDEVYTGGRDARLPSPMYYGKVVEARLNPGATAWDIRVQPAATNTPLETVQVLRTRLNPHRIAAQ